MVFSRRLPIHRLHLTSLSTASDTVHPPSCQLLTILSCVDFFLNPHPRICLFIDFQERERSRGRGETLICCSAYLCIHWLSLLCALTGDRTCNLLVHRTALQVTEPPSWGCFPFFNLIILICFSSPESRIP